MSGVGGSNPLAPTQPQKKTACYGCFLYPRLANGKNLVKLTLFRREIAVALTATPSFMVQRRTARVRADMRFFRGKYPGGLIP